MDILAFNLAWMEPERLVHDAALSRPVKRVNFSEWNRMSS